ncbi:MAG: DUF4105 domain-containing protein [Thermodesulfobacteriota bacterium]|nr:DUF4105 domain-containing protein [Thermodesulfobacteriota bacterium]
MTYRFIRKLVIWLFFSLAVAGGLVNAAEQAAESETSFIKDDLLHQFNVELAECGSSGKWTVDDAIRVGDTLRSLPVELQTLCTSNITPIRIYRDYHSGLSLSVHGPSFAGDDTIHIFDRPTAGVFAMLSQENSAAQRLIQWQLTYSLLHLYDNTYHVSRSPQWMAISGWTHRRPFGVTLPFCVKGPDNQDIRGYAHPSGMKSPSEDFVTTALFFVLPPDSTIEDSIKCRIPKKYNFLTSIFPAFHSPLESPGITCCSMDDCFLDDLMFLDPNNGNGIDVGPVNMDTVDGIEVLYAMPGSGDVAEIAGHLLLRIRLNNNPKAKQRGIENPNDLVISFLADTGEEPSLPPEQPVKIPIECKKNWFNLVNNDPGNDAMDSVIQSLKGLSGGFLTLMDRQTLAQALKSYTVEQDRNLLRYRLNLTDTQKRNLLDRLFRAKKNYKTGYYFFNKNCASVLIKVVAQGIGNDEIMNFDPLVSPPNTLIGLLVRNKIATWVYPSFYSYRKQGYIAQDILRKEYTGLIHQFPDSGWPDIYALFSKNDTIRAYAVIDISKVVKRRPEIRHAAYRLSALMQEAEMAFSHKDLVCERYTTPATAEARRLQKFILSVSQEGEDEFRVSMDRLISGTYSTIEQQGAAQGYPHTGHYALTVGAGYYHSDKSKTGVFTLDGALHHQDMGSASSIAMQRSGYVDLGRARAVFTMEGPDHGRINEWEITGLNIRKFKDRLGRVPSVFSSARSFGIGLTLVDITSSREIDKLSGTVAGVAALFSLFSSEENNRFLYVSAGADMVACRQQGNDSGGIRLPFRAEYLWTFDNRRKWQWRAEATYNVTTCRNISDNLHAGTSLTFRSDFFQAQEVLFRFSTDYRKDYATVIDPENHERFFSQVQAEIHFW